MANIKSAQKRAKQAIKKRERNRSRKSEMKTAEKKVLESLARGDDIETTQKLFREAEARIARAKGKGVIHSNTAARKVSRLAKKVATAEKAA